MSEIIKIILIVLLFVTFFTFLIFIVAEPSKIKKKYIGSIEIFIIGIIILGIFFLNRNINNENKISEADGFTIQSYNVNMDVKENNEIDITETIIVDWYENGHHGIYKFTPNWLKYTGKDGKTISRKSEIYNLEAIGEEYTIDIVNQKERIKIGNPDSYVPLGKHEYIIKYTYNMGNDPFENFDELIFHTYGDYWGTRINNATITINMPKDFDASKIKFFDDKYRKNDITKYVKYEKNGNKLNASLSSNYELYKSLTVDIELPDNYFTQDENNYGNASLISCLLIISFAILSFIRWFRFGKDYNKISPTVEFYPPENMDAAEIGYIYTKENNNKLTISLIVELASKGYVKIDEDKNNKRIITKTEKNGNMTQNEKCVYDNLFIGGNTTNLSENTNFYKTFEIIGKNLSENLDEKIMEKKSYVKMFSTSILFLIGTLLWMISYGIFEDLNPKFDVLYIISFISLFAIELFAFLMKRKTTYGEKITAEILGFQNFIKTAEKDRIEELVMENPNYFYDILPYAYVLGVSKKWIEKFEDIPIPDNDMGNFNYCDINSFNNLSDSVTMPEGSSGSSIGGCSSCGGGCSSCGGGGSW